MTNFCGAGYVPGTVLSARNTQMNKKEFCTRHSQFGRRQICKRVGLYLNTHGAMPNLWTAVGGAVSSWTISESLTEETTLKLSHKNDQKLAVRRWRAGTVQGEGAM